MEYLAFESMDYSNKISQKFNVLIYSKTCMIGQIACNARECAQFLFSYSLMMYAWT